jgi:PTH1 family peptidyl-tRNA hydrolase
MGIRLIVGLGNPGKEYERTRHNAGFWLLERFAAQERVALRKDTRYQALVGRHEPSGAWLVMPQSFMNASGRAVQMLAGFFRIPAADILVVHDELDFAPGAARIKQGGGIAGHNGLKDISQRLGTHEYWRLRIGIGHPGDKGAVADYVLHKPSAEDREAIDGAIGRALEVLPQCLAGDMQGAMQKLHSGDKPAAPRPAAEPAAPKERPEARAQVAAPAKAPERAPAAKPPEKAPAKAVQKTPQESPAKEPQKPGGVKSLLKSLLQGPGRKK